MKTVGEIIDFEGKKFIILTNFSDEGIDYSFINETYEDSEEVTDVYYIIKYNFDGSFEKVTDQAVVEKIYPKLQEELKKVLEENNISIDEAIEGYKENPNGAIEIEEIEEGE